MRVSLVSHGREYRSPVPPLRLGPAPPLQPSQLLRAAAPEALPVPPVQVRPVPSPRLAPSPAQPAPGSPPLPWTRQATRETRPEGQARRRPSRRPHPDLRRLAGSRLGHLPPRLPTGAGLRQRRLCPLGAGLPTGFPLPLPRPTPVFSPPRRPVQLEKSSRTPHRPLKQGPVDSQSPSPGPRGRGTA